MQNTPKAQDQKGAERYDGLKPDRAAGEGSATRFEKPATGKPDSPGKSHPQPGVTVPETAEGTLQRSSRMKPEMDDRKAQPGKNRPETGPDRSQPGITRPEVGEEKSPQRDVTTPETARDDPYPQRDVTVTETAGDAADPQPGVTVPETAGDSGLAPGVNVQEIG